VRLHAALMPNYNRRAATFWWLMVVLGALVLGYCLVWLAQQPWQTALQIAIGLALAVGSGLFPVRVPGTKESFAAGEVFIFLVLLLLGPQAAAIVAAGETGLGAFRTSKRWTSRLVSPAISALAIWSAGSVLALALEQLAAQGLTGAAPVAGATMLFAALYFVVNAVLLTGIYRLNRGEPFLKIIEPVSTLRWVGMAYAGSAALATLLFVVYRQQGSSVLWVMVPLLAMLLVTLHFYFRQQEAHEALKVASAGVAEREAAMASREKEAAERHLRELQLSEQRFHSAFTHASIGMALLDLEGRVLQVNRAMAQLLGLEEAELLERGFYDFVQREDRSALDAQLAGASRQGFDGFALELRGQHRDNSTVWMALNCSFFTEPGADSPLLILQAQDISGRRRAEAGLQHMAFHDSLTGLPNRRRFLECLAGAVARFQANPARPWAVMFIDFDRFKLVNDSLGHTAGDELLIQMARRVQERLRPSDIVARLGGDEFAILADHIDDERHALVLAERLMEALRRPFLIGDVELIASASIGITFSALGYTNAEDALRDADTAMYKAKGAGKARYAVFDASLHTAVADRLRLEGELRRAIDRGELTVEYQPVFELGSAPTPGNGKLAGFEALVRWQHPQDGRLLPGSFLHVAEESGLMLALSDFVMHSACHQLRQWQLSSPANERLTISINLSAHDLASPALVARVSRAIVESGLRAQDLTLELTENILMSHIEGALGALAALRKLGVKLAVDDFGTGYSSLSHLSKLPIDSLKIDRSFVSALQRDSADAAVVSAIIQLGAALRKAVVAEGIESAQQMDHLRELGCGFGQGFHMATPLTAQVAGEWLARPVGLH
jgi:diguanylate cyclase (GGDEF)-like protein/PAS domain S-box-containing protein